MTSKRGTKSTQQQEAEEERRAEISLAAEWRRAEISEAEGRRRFDLLLQRFEESFSKAVAEEDVEDTSAHGDAGYVILSLPSNAHLAAARERGKRSGQYQKMVWFDGAPRIFAKLRSFDKAGEADARSLFVLIKDPRAFSDPNLLINAVSAALALNSMRWSERRVLKARLESRSKGDGAWSVIARDVDDGIRSVPLTKEIFKVALAEFLSLYARAVSKLRAEEERRLIAVVDI